MSPYFGNVKFCKHGRPTQDCRHCRVKTKPLSKAVIKQAQQILTGRLQPTGGRKCLCHTRKEKQ